MAPPPATRGRMNAGVCVFGIPYACGFLWAGTAQCNPRPLTAQDVVDLTVESGLTYAELSSPMYGDINAPQLRLLCNHGLDQGVEFIVSGGQLRAEGLEQDLRVAMAVGARTVRCILSSVLCGDRRTMQGGWPEHLRRCERELEAVLPLFERHRVTLAMENHQDATSAELAALCQRFQSPYLGVTLDTGNPLAVMEEPMDFARAVGPYLRHVHMKDYRIYPAPTGFRLVRCPMGAGVIDFPGLLKFIDELPQPVSRSIELAALNARLIPVLERSWWDTYPDRDAREILPALAVVWRKLRPAHEEWRTPVEREVPREEVATWEWDEYWKSVAYLKGISGLE